MDNSCLQCAAKQGIRIRQFKDFTLVPASQSDRDTLSDIALEKSERCRIELLHRDGQPIETLALREVVIRSKQEALRKLVDEKRRSWKQVLNAGESWVQTKHGDWRLRLSLPTEGDDLAANADAVVGDLLTALGYYSRPLRHYSCTFYLPLPMADSAEGERWVRQLEKRAEDGEDVVHYRYPVGDYRADGENDECEDKKRVAEALAKRHEREAAAFWYFSPASREQLFELKGKDGEAYQSQHRVPIQLREYRLSAKWLRGSYLRLPARKSHNWVGAPEAVEAKLDDVVLYRFYDNNLVLGVTVSPRRPLPKVSNEKTYNEDRHWWRELAYGSEETLADLQNSQAAVWLDFTMLSRVLYPSFIQQAFEDKFRDLALLDAGGKQRAEAPGGEKLCFPEQPGERLSPIIRFLLCAFFVGGDGDRSADALNTHWDRFQELYDDRMYAHASYGLAGPAARNEHERHALDAFYAVSLYVDREGWESDFSGFPYDEQFVRNLMTEQEITRWANQGNRYGYTNYSSVHVGFGWFYLNVIAPEHVPFHYARMAVLNLMYQMTLRMFRRRITRRTHEIADTQALPDYPEQTEVFRKLRRDFILFTNKYWFSDVTEQIQGQEMFRCQQQVLGLRGEYELIKEEMAWADDYIESERGNYYQRKAEVGATIGLLLALLAAAVTFIQMTPEPSGNYTIWQRVLAPSTWSAIGLTLSLGAGVWLVVKFRQWWKSPV